MFDTLVASRRLENRGFTREQSEEIVEMIRDTQSDLFIKKDGDNLEERLTHKMETNKEELKYDITHMELKLNSKIESVELRLNGKIEKMELSLTIKIGLLMVTIFGIGCTIIKTFNIF